MDGRRTRSTGTANFFYPLPHPHGNRFTEMLVSSGEAGERCGMTPTAMFIFMGTLDGSRTLAQGELGNTNTCIGTQEL